MATDSKDSKANEEYLQLCHRAVRRLQVKLPAGHPLVSVTQFMCGSQLLRFGERLSYQILARKNMDSALEGFEKALGLWEPAWGEHWFIEMARNLGAKADERIRRLIDRCQTPIKDIDSASEGLKKALGPWEPAWGKDWFIEMARNLMANIDESIRRLTDR